MAEIRVRPKPRSLAWLWVLVALLVLALVAWYAVSHGVVRVRGGGAGAADSLTLTPHA
jgi:hypothetical protein